MLEPTNDPIAAARRKQEAAARADREALAASGTQQFQAVRKLAAALEELKGVVEELAELVEALQLVVDAVAAQQAVLETQQTALAAQQAALTTLVTQTAAQIDFLESQTVGADRDTVWSFDGSPSGSWESFDATYDISLSITSSSSGSIAVTVAGSLLSQGVGAVLGFEVLWSGGSVAPELRRSAMSVVAAGGSVAALATASRTSKVTVPANTALTVRTRRRIWGGGSGDASVNDQSLVVSKQW